MNFGEAACSTSPRVRQGYRICQAICEFRLGAKATDKPLAPYLPLKRGGRRAQRGGWGSLRRRRVIPTRSASRTDLPFSRGGGASGILLTQSTAAPSAIPLPAGRRS